MNIQLLYEVQERPWGGVNSFFRNFRKYATQEDRITLVDSPSRADIILTVGNYVGPGEKLSSRRLWWLSKWCGISWPPVPTGTIRHAKSKILFRLDGLRKIYTGTWNSSDKRLVRNLQFADSVIFQSKFSKESFDNLGVQIPSNQLVINNGADEEVFFPEKARKPPIGKDLVLISNSWSTNSYKGFHNIAAISCQEGVRVLHIGRWPEGVCKENVTSLGIMGPREIATVFRQGDFFFFPSKNEACPNVLFEALACALPAIYLKSGGNIEICGGGKFGIPFEEKTFGDGQVPELLAQAREKHDEIRANIIEDINRFSFTRCFSEYLAFFESLLV
jgi:glycosyltransferase involved in cell wall biosynthesis